MVCREDLDQFLKEISSKSMLAEHLVSNLIKPAFLIMLCISVEQEGEFGLHLDAAGHVNYARYDLCYIKTMEKLHIAVLHPYLCEIQAIKMGYEMQSGSTC